MVRMVFFTLTVFFLFCPEGRIYAQADSEIHVNGSSNLDREFSSLMNDLELRTDQKLVLGILILKYAAEFNFSEFEDATKAKQYTMARSTIKDLDKDLKEVLDKQQYKVYKKHRKRIKKELLKTV